MALQLSTGNVAGLIQALIFITNILTMLALTFVLGAFLRDRNSAATWTAASQAFARSHWPSLLRTDSAYNHSVRRPVLLSTICITAMTYLISLAGIITPLGLSQAWVQSSATMATFQLAPDNSVFGQGTTPRGSGHFSRICLSIGGTVVPNVVTCPFSDTVTVIERFSNATVDYTYPYGYNVSIPQRVMDTYSGGTQNETTISNFFDIQYRQYLPIPSTTYNNGSTYDVGVFRMIQSLIDNADYLVVEGLVVDMVNGGVGFRNHTFPPGFPDGVSWTEDLLFVEPETVCVDTNLTLDFTIASSSRNSSSYPTSVSVDNYVLTDRGGFSNFNTTMPDVDLADAQANPDLYGRAYYAAWLNNGFTAVYLNVTAPNENSSTGSTRAWSYLNSYVGKSFPMPLPGSVSSFGQIPTLGTGLGYGAYLGLSGIISGAVIVNNSSPGNSATYPNPFSVNETIFFDIAYNCAGTGVTANISNVVLACGLMYGTPRHTDGSPGVVFDADSNWTQPIYSCASAIKAKVRTVSFTYNGTTGLLQGLNVTNIQEKTYDKTDDVPLWGVEQTGGQYKSQQINLVWGMVSAASMRDANVSTVRRNALYLPGYTYTGGEWSSMYSTDDNLPGAEVFSSCIGAAYAVGAAPTGYSTSALPDYTGQTNLALFYRWQNATQSPSTAGLVPNLIFTDCAASLVVGTKSLAGAAAFAASKQQGSRLPLVTPTVEVVRYDYRFGVPAFLAALGLLLSVLAALAVVLFQRHRPSRMRQLIQLTSPGRIFTAVVGPLSGTFTDTAKTWSSARGADIIDPYLILGERGGAPPHNEKAASSSNKSESLDPAPDDKPPAVVVQVHDGGSNNDLARPVQPTSVPADAKVPSMGGQAEAWAPDGDKAKTERGGKASISAV